MYRLLQRFLDLIVVRATTDPSACDQYSRRLDSQLAQLVETVWAEEKMWRLEARIEAAIGHDLRT